MIHLGHIWAVGRMDPKSDKINYGNDPFGTYLGRGTYGGRMGPKSNHLSRYGWYGMFRMVRIFDLFLPMSSAMGANIFGD